MTALAVAPAETAGTTLGRNPFGLFQNSSEGRTVADDLLESADPTFLICHYH